MMYPQISVYSIHNISCCDYKIKNYYKDEVSFGVSVFELPRGTRDFSPAEMYVRRYIEKKLSTVFRSYGYKEVQTPTFEYLELFTAKSGEQIIDEIYSFRDKGGRDLALRPELTAPVIRFYASSMQMDPKPLKLFYFGNCYRYDRPQKGRYREFMQAGCELIGTNTPEAIAEMISMAYALVREVGVKQISLEIGDLSLLHQIFELFNISEDQRDELVPLIDKQEFEGIEELLHEFGIADDQCLHMLSFLAPSSIDQIQSTLDSIGNELCDLTRLRTIFTLLKESFSIMDVTINLGIVRGLEYYSGIVFEIEAPSLGAEKQICGGGEYELLSLFSARELPTAGFALGFDRTILAMEMENQSVPKDFIDYFIIPVGGENISYALSVAQQLRSYHLTVDIELMGRNVGKSMKYANTKQAKYTIIIGYTERKQDAVTIRDMTTGEQTLVSLHDLYKRFDQ